MKKLLCLLIAVCGIHSSTLGFELNFNGFAEWDPIKNKFSIVHYTLPDTQTNNYQGSFFWLPSQQKLPAVQVSYNGNTKSCSKQVRGLYYTNAKGARLWPLDEQTLNGLKLLNSDYNNLQIEGGIYTTCGASGSTDIYSLYGQVTFKTTGGLDLGTLSAGFIYDATTNKVKTTQGLYPSLQYFNNQTPLGYIYDNVAGIGFVGWQLTVWAHQAVLNALEWWLSINQIFGFGSNQNEIIANVPGGPFTISSGISAWLDTLWNISVLGNVLLSRGWLDVTNRQSVLGNPSLSSSVVFSDIVNTSDILNALRKNGDALCRGQQKYGGEWAFFDDDGNQWNLDEMGLENRSVLCFVNDQDSESYIAWQRPLWIDLSNPNIYDGKEIIVKGRNVVLANSMPNDESVLNLFVDNGNVYLQDAGPFATQVANTTAETAYKTFDKWGNYIGWQWWPAYQMLTAMGDNPSSGSQLSAGRIYQGLLSHGGTGANGVWKVNYGRYIKGNIFVNGILAGYNVATRGPSNTAYKYYFHGRLASLNTALAQSDKRNTLLTNLFGNAATEIQSYVDFSKVFVWQCQLNGFASDGEGNMTTQPCMVQDDLFKFSPFILINTPIATKLLQ